MVVQWEPDIDNYLDRIAEIEALIITGSKVVKNPKNAPTDPPFWLHMAGGGAPQKGASNEVFLTYNVRILLVRKRGIGAFDDYAVEATIQGDFTTVAWNFMMIDDYRNLRTPTYTAVQAGFALDSVTISNQVRWEGDSSVGPVTGSRHTLTWSHRMVNRP
jgi:hypothetical protein